MKANFITDDAFIKEYNGRVESNFDNSPILRVLNYVDGIVVGSNHFAVALVNSMKPLGMRVVNPLESERVISTNTLDLRNNYVDTALVLRSDGEPNLYLASNLIKQVSKRGYDLNVPLVIPLAGLEVVKDTHSPQGLAFKLTDSAQIIKAFQLTTDNNGKNFSTFDAFGLPNPEVKKGSRILNTGNSGLSGLSTIRNMTVNSSYNLIEYSNNDGRIVLFRDN